MSNLSCPHCRQMINDQAISCPHCHTTLKAYGHPGIPVYRSTGKNYLCDSCTYHLDDTCNFTKRPYAQDCTIYQNHEEIQKELKELANKKSLKNRIDKWLIRNQGFILILVLLLGCFLFTIFTS
ncbi:MAG: zinc ribbon domain-containing protein [Nostocales cyanobacterium]|nr:MAG: zinc ribbon domain-containing protein [Nostocales cyanobacterium]TAF17067.1 MAG: zinc ribbon domain-containing protein [Nostocales cyanobacterium]